MSEIAASRRWNPSSTGEIFSFGKCEGRCFASFPLRSMSARASHLAERLLRNIMPTAGPDIFAKQIHHTPKVYIICRRHISYGKAVHHCRKPERLSALSWEKQCSAQVKPWAERIFSIKFWLLRFVVGILYHKKNFIASQFGRFLKFFSSIFCHLSTAYQQIYQHLLILRYTF